MSVSHDFLLLMKHFLHIPALDRKGPLHPSGSRTLEAIKHYHFLINCKFVIIFESACNSETH
jgi:hypothetical protein